MGTLVLIVALGTFGQNLLGIAPVPPEESFSRSFSTPIPKNVRVAHYYGDAFGMDPSFAWELSPIDDALLKRMLKNARLKPATRTERPGGHTFHWPAWWNKERIERLPEVYYRDDGVLVRVWVDRRAKRLFVEYVNL
jgi:hypothetical protein